MAEPYQSLYRRFRPRRFGEVRGQERVTETLRRAVAEGHVSHAYLFSGPRGTGKTSTARILAMALNCEAPVDGEPCLACASCEAVVRGSSADVEELDAASNSGVDSIRWITQTVAAAPVGRWRVYIVDEVHMLSQAASNALLKTLEEPPAHVVFILATTNPAKVLATVRSRTQHFAFRLLDDASVDALVAEVLEALGASLSDEALAYVRRRGGGSARDTLSVLEQVLALGGVVNDAADGAVALAQAIADGDLASAVRIASDAFEGGIDPTELVADTVGDLGRRFVAEALAGARGAELARLSRPLETLGRLGAGLRDALDPQVVVLAGLAEALAPDARLSALEARVAALEADLAGAGHMPRPKPPSSEPLPARSTSPEPVGHSASPSAAEPETREPETGERAPRAPARGLQDARRGGDEHPGASTEQRPSSLDRVRAAFARNQQRADVDRGEPSEPVATTPAPRGGALRGGDDQPAEAPDAHGSPVPSGLADEAPRAAGPAALEARRQRLQARWFDDVMAKAPRTLRPLLAHARLAIRDERIVVAVDNRTVAERLVPHLAEIVALVGPDEFAEPPEIVVDPGSSPGSSQTSPREPAASVDDRDPGDDDGVDLADAPSSDATPVRDLSESVIEANVRSIFEDARRLS